MIGIRLFSSALRAFAKAPLRAAEVGTKQMPQPHKQVIILGTQELTDERLESRAIMLEDAEFAQLWESPERHTNLLAFRGLESMAPVRQCSSLRCHAFLSSRQAARFVPR